MKINDLFNKVIEIDGILNNNLLEISVKRHQITLSIKNSLVYANDIDSMLKMFRESIKGDSFLSTNNDIFYFTFGSLSLETLDSENNFYPFLALIENMAQEICSCPSLEFIISPQYIKCFLDKPGLRIEDLSKYEELLEAKGQGELELHPQRPYLLFINTEYNFEEKEDIY